MSPATSSEPPTPPPSRWASGSREEKLAALCNLQPMPQDKGVGCACCPPFDAKACSSWKPGDALFEVDMWFPGSFSGKGQKQTLMHLKRCEAPSQHARSGATVLLEDGPPLKPLWHSNDGSSSDNAALLADGQVSALGSAYVVISPGSWLVGWNLSLSTYQGEPNKEASARSLLDMPTSAFAECTSDAPRKKRVFIGWVRSLSSDKDVLTAKVAYASGKASKAIEESCELLRDRDIDDRKTWEEMGKVVGKVHSEDLVWTWNGTSPVPSKETKAALGRITAAQQGAFSSK